jgi:hypothetical protein
MTAAPAPAPAPELAPASAPASAPAPGETARLQADFERFARIGCPEDPVYVAISEAAAGRGDWAGLLAAAPREQRLPTLWFAAVHDRLLELHDAGGPEPALAAWYPSLGGHRTPDRALVQAVDAFLSTEDAPVRERIAARSTQTNEVGRSAVLHPILRQLARRGCGPRFALLDVGCSAGLNLGVDHWCYRYVDDESGREIAAFAGRGGAAAPRIESRVLADDGLARFAASWAAEPASVEPAIVDRLGVDPAPVDLDDPVAVRWLRACVWPYDTTRRRRLEAAVAVARERRWPVRRVAAERIGSAITQWLATIAPGVQPVVFNSWVLAYFEPAAVEAHVALLRHAIETSGLAWISAEPIERVRRWWADVPDLGDPPAGACATADDMRAATIWTVATRGRDGRVAWSLAARSHAHGRWLQWR